MSSDVAKVPGTEEPAARSALARVALGLAVAPAWTALFVAIAPRVPAPPLAPVLEFALAVGGAIAALAVASRARVAPRVHVVAVVVAAGVLGALSRVPFSMAGVVLVSFALVTIGWGIGAAIGERVQDPGHLLPARAVAACADVVSVVSPSGPTHAILESQRALTLLALSFPAFGTSDAGPAVGVGDLVMVALLLAAARKHGLPYARVAALAFAGALGAVAVSAFVGEGVPALPTIGAAVIAGVPRVRTLARRDRAPAQVFIVLAIAAAIATVASRLGWVPGAPPPSSP